MSNLMSNEQAKEALRNGMRLTHSYFTPREWVQGRGCVYVFEDGVSCSPAEFWSIRNDFPPEWVVIE